MRNYVNAGVSSTRARLDAAIRAVAADSRNDHAPAHLRVLMVTQSYYPFLERGGSAATVHALAQGLAQRGHSVTVLTSDLGISTQPMLVPAVAKTTEGWRYDQDSVETIYLSSRGSYRALTWNPGIFAFCANRLSSFDIVHIYGTYDLLGPVVARACRRAGVPYVFEPMGMFRPIVRNVVLKSVYRQLFGEFVANGAAQLVATSLQEQRELIEEGIAAEKITIRRNGIDLPTPSTTGALRLQWKIPQDAFLVLFLGRIVPKKSPELLLEAFARWRRFSVVAMRSVLVFAGPSESASYVRRLQAEVKRLGLTESVLFTGALYGDAKWSALMDADIFVLPSQNENFGNAAAEAVACSTPVIVTNRCGIAPLVEGRAGLVISHECEALIRALGQLSDPGLRTRMKLGCKEVARGLGWEQPLAETEAVYAQLLSDLTEARTEAPRAAQYEPERPAPFEPERSARRDLSS
jgi:glycosyltransferase involved in cell wall biosynthesis